ncbi:MAG: hypothetical protein AB1489_41395 [Acidobacteriota bacterium]
MQSNHKPSVKGQYLKIFLKFMETQLDKTQQEMVLEKLEPEYREKLTRKTFLATDLFPVEIVNRISRELALIKGETLEQLSYRAGRFILEDGLSGVYKAFGYVLDPMRLLSKAPIMWTTINDTGRMEVEELAANRVKLNLFDCPVDISQCWRSTGWATRMLEIAEAKNIQIIHTKCYSRGDNCCEWKIEWEL